MTLIVVVVVIAMIFSFLSSLFLEIGGKSIRASANCLIILFVAIFVGVAIADYGAFGNPVTLDRKTYYKVLSVTPIDEQSTIVILRDGNNMTIPIKFVTKIDADANGLYTLVGHTYQSYTLAPIK